MIKSMLHIGALACAITVISTIAASAAPGQALSAVNVRTGPGTNYNKVGTLSAGEIVDVKQCQSGWCFVDRNGPTDGWVSQNYLAIQTGNAPPPPSGGNSNQPNFGFSFQTPDGGTISFGMGNPPPPPQPQPQPQPQPNPPPPPPPPPPAVAQACFYAGPNFTDIRFCDNQKRTVNQLTMAWNNRISSIRLTGGAQVIVCQDQFLGGTCQNISSSRAQLGAFNNVISSYRTH